MRLTALVLLSAVLSACVGAMVVSEGSSIDKSPGLTLQRQRGVVDPYGSGPSYTKFDVRKLWGEPDAIAQSGSVEYWHYNREIGWSGLLIGLVIPIPLMVPTGYRETILEFSGDNLLKVDYRHTKGRGLLCGILQVHSGFRSGCTAT